MGIEHIEGGGMSNPGKVNFSALFSFMGLEPELADKLLIKRRKSIIQTSDINLIDEYRQQLIANTTSPSLFRDTVRHLFEMTGINVAITAHKSKILSSINNALAYELDQTTLEDYNKQLAAAKEAQVIWSKLGLRGRQEFFRIMYERALPKRADSIILKLAIDTGKPIKLCRGEYEKGLDFYRWAISDAVSSELTQKVIVTDDKQRRIVLTQDDKIIICETNGALTVHDALPNDVAQLNFEIISPGEPLKLIGAMSPANYPWALEGQDEVMRLAGGVMFSKPPSATPAAIHEVVQAEKEALQIMGDNFSGYEWKKEAVDNGVDLGQKTMLQILQDGLHNIIIGRDEEVMAQWFRDMDVMRIVASRETGQEIDRQRSESGFAPIRTIIELGGNNPVTIMPESCSYHVANAVKATLEDNWKTSGQRCTHPGRLFLHKDISENALNQIRQIYQGFCNDPFKAGLGHPLEWETKYGPLANKKIYDKMQNYLQQARELGAEVIGGERIKADDNGQRAWLDSGYYTTPAAVMWTQVEKEKKQLMHKHEVFAWVLNIDAIDNVEDAAQKTNASTECLSGGFYGSKEQFDEYAALTRIGSLYHNSQPKDGSPWWCHKGTGDSGRGNTGGVKIWEHYLRRDEASERVTILRDKENFMASLRSMRDDKKYILSLN